jgi:hypothetical protein
VTGLEAAVAGEAAKAVVTQLAAGVWQKLAGVPPDQRPGFAGLQPLVIESAQDLVNKSADVLILVEPLGLADILNRDERGGGFRTRCELLLTRGAEIRELVSIATPILAGMQQGSLRAVPRLDPQTALRLDSAVQWYGWLLGSLLDLADEAQVWSKTPGKRVKETWNDSVAGEASPEFLASVLMCHQCLAAARTAHELLQAAASVAIGTAIGADERAHRAASRKVRRDDAWRRSMLASRLERLADGIDDAVSSPSLATRARRLIFRLVRG